MSQLSDNEGVLTQFGPLKVKCLAVECQCDKYSYSHVIRCIFKAMPSDEQAFVMALSGRNVEDRTHLAFTVRPELFHKTEYARRLWGDVAEGLADHFGARDVLISNALWFAQEATNAVIAQRTSARP